MLKKLGESLDNALRNLPREVLLGFWISMIPDLLGYKILALALRWIAFGIMTVLMGNYYLGLLSARIYKKAYEIEKGKNGNDLGNK